jgi:hypothetical protein
MLCAVLGAIIAVLLMVAVAAVMVRSSVTRRRNRRAAWAALERFGLKPDPAVEAEIRGCGLAGIAGPVWDVAGGTYDGWVMRTFATAPVTSTNSPVRSRTCVLVAVGGNREPVVVGGKHYVPGFHWTEQPTHGLPDGYTVWATTDEAAAAVLTPAVVQTLTACPLAASIEVQGPWLWCGYYGHIDGERIETLVPLAARLARILASS